MAKESFLNEEETVMEGTSKNTHIKERTLLSQIMQYVVVFPLHLLLHSMDKAKITNF